VSVGVRWAGVWACLFFCFLVLCLVVVVCFVLFSRFVLVGFFFFFLGGGWEEFISPGKLVIRLKLLTVLLTGHSYHVFEIAPLCESFHICN